MKRAVLLVLLAIGGVLAIFRVAARFEDERMVYGYRQLAGDPSPSGVVERLSWPAVAAAAVVIVGGVAVGILVWQRSR